MWPTQLVGFGELCAMHMTIINVNLLFMIGAQGYKHVRSHTFLFSKYF